jgi:AraC family transcriptional regulator
MWLRNFIYRSETLLLGHATGIQETIIRLPNLIIRLVNGKPTKNQQNLFNCFQYYFITMKTTTRKTYAERIGRVQEYIARNLEQDLDFHRLAEEAFMSPFHFHRVYVAMMGETLVETIRRRRLHAAAMNLLASAKSVTKLANEGGYTSVQAFNRAFRDAYGVTPKQYRIHGELSLAIQKSINLTKTEHPMYLLKDVHIEDLPSIPMLSVRHLGDYQTIGIAFEKLMVWAAGKNLLTTPMRTFALYYDDPISKPKQDLVSDPCLCLPSSVDITSIANGDVKVLTIAASRCATYTFKGPYSELDKPYRWL